MYIDNASRLQDELKRQPAMIDRLYGIYNTYIYSLYIHCLYSSNY